MIESRNGKKERQIILRLMLHLLDCQKERKNFASSGNRTRAARVAGEHSTTEPTMLSCCYQGILSIHIWQNRRQQQEKIRGR